MRFKLYLFFKIPNFANVFIFAMLMVLSQTGLAQEQLKVKGSVKDSIGSVPGVGVAVEGTSIGTATDGNGNYSLNVPTSGMLLFKFVGFVTQRFDIKDLKISPDGDYVLDVVMRPDDNQLDEVAVVGFGVQKKTTMVGAVTTINPKELKGPTSNLTQMLAGRLGGVIAYQRSGEPGSDNANFFVRGLGSFGTGQVSPLILIDGVESTQNDLARLQPDDISNFSVLKDATAAAVYGARGANGIILVTTKVGESGKTKFGFRVENTVSGNTENFQFADNITYMKLANQAALTRNELALPYTQTKIDRTASGTANPYLYPSNNWIDQIIKDYTANQRYNMNVSGGADKARYYIAGTFNVDNGVYKVDKLNNFNNNVKLLNYSIRSNVSIQFTKSTKAEIRVYGQFDDYNGPLGGGKEIFQTAIAANPVMFPAIFPAEYSKGLKHPMFGNAISPSVQGSSLGGSLYNNPYALLVQGYRQQNKSNLQPQVELHQDLEGVIQGLKLRFMGYVQRNSSFAISRSYNPFFYSAGSLDGSDITLTPINPGGPGSFGTTGSEYLSYGEGEKELKSSLYTETALNYNRIFKENHSVGAMVVTTMRNSLTGNAGTLERSLPKRNMGVSGRVTYGYKETYLAEFNFGYNGTERFAANHRYGFFPAIGFGYNISNEPFFKPLTSVISRFKLRGTYGLNGNDAIGRDEDRFFYLSNVDLTGGPGASFGEDPSNLYTRPGVTVLRYANDRITWETSRQLNLGADISLFNDINLTIDAYRKTTSNILQPRSAVPTTMGLLADAVANVGKSQSQGIDFQADYNKSLGTKTWMQIRGTMTYATNKILFYDEPSYPASTSYLTKVGRSFDQQLGFVAERLFTDDIEVANSPSQSAIAGGVAVRGGDIKYRDMNNDGLINNDDRVFMGLPTTPEMVYGFGFSLTHGSFDLNAQVQGSARSSLFINAGGFNFNNLNQSGISPFVQAGGYQSGLLKAIADDHWSEDNRNAYAFWPRLSSVLAPNNTVRSNWWMRDAAFLRLQQVEIGYTPKDKLLSRFGLSNLRIYASARNLFAFSNFKLWDPEMGGNGLDYPLQRVYNIGLNVGF